MADKRAWIDKKMMKDLMQNKREALNARMEEMRSGFQHGVKTGMQFMLEVAEEKLDELAFDVMHEMDKAENAQTKFIGVAEWALDENGHLICSHCGGEAWARKYNEAGEGGQMPSQHCPWCGYEMRCYR